MSCNLVISMFSKLALTVLLGGGSPSHGGMGSPNSSHAQYLYFFFFLLFLLLAVKTRPYFAGAETGAPAVIFVSML